MLACRISSALVATCICTTIVWRQSWLTVARGWPPQFHALPLQVPWLPVLTTAR